MIKKLSAIGNSLGLVIEKPVLDLLNIDKDTLLEITTDGDGLKITPLREKQARLRKAAERAMDKHAKAFEKLAE